MKRWLFWVCYEWTLIASAVALAIVWPMLWPLVVLFIGTRQHALAVLGHEAVHYSVHKNRKINNLLGNLLCMWPLAADVEGYRKWHLRHHQFVGTDLDPEKAQHALFPNSWSDLSPAKKRILIIEDLLGLNWREPVSLLRTTGGTWSAVRVAYVALVAGLMVLTHWSLLAVWILAIGTSTWASMRARIWREHLGPEVTSVYVAKWWERFLYLPHYIWKHEAHHRKGNWSTPAWELRKG